MMLSSGALYIGMELESRIPWTRETMAEFAICLIRGSIVNNMTWSIFSRSLVTICPLCHRAWLSPGEM